MESSRGKCACSDVEIILKLFALSCFNHQLVSTFTSRFVYPAKRCANTHNVATAEIAVCYQQLPDTSVSQTSNNH